MKCFVLGALLALVLPLSAAAQSTPGLTYGQVPTAGQWNSYFGAKQDVLGYTPLNTAGGTLTGKLITTPSSISRAGVNVPSGVAPSVPVDGDIWTTSAGIFVQINGSTVGPLASSGSLATTPILSISTNYTVLPADVASGSLILDVDVTSAPITITVPVTLGSAGSSPVIRINKIDQSTNSVLINDGTNTIDSIITPASALGQVNGYRSVYSNGTNLRSSGNG